jgi:DNA-binding response OmpR family regulator
MPRILIVEDEEPMRLGLRDNLEFEDYEVDMAADGEEGLAKILNHPYDLILLDVMLPKKSGFDVCKEVRKRNITTPILMLTAKGEEIDKVLGLELGADDYITKPFSLRELIARIKAVLRRSGPPKSANVPVKIGRLEINFKSYEAHEDDQPIKLSHKEFEILKYFQEHPNETIERDTLLNQIWGYDGITTTRTVDNFILKLRQKIEQDPANPRHILTVHGIGYKYISD